MFNLPRPPFSSATVGPGILPTPRRGNTLRLFRVSVNSYRRHTDNIPTPYRRALTNLWSRLRDILPTQGARHLPYKKQTQSRRAACAVFAALLAVPATAQQIEPFSDASGYSVARVMGQPVCFASLRSESASGQEFIYSYFQTNVGQRWHTIGYVEPTSLLTGTATLRVSVDAELALDRATETRDGDFMLPFQALEEITALEAMVPEGVYMTIEVAENNDTIAIELARYRDALVAIDACLGAP